MSSVVALFGCGGSSSSSGSSDSEGVTGIWVYTILEGESKGGYRPVLVNQSGDNITFTGSDDERTQVTGLTRNGQLIEKIDTKEPFLTIVSETEMVSPSGASVKSRFVKYNNESRYNFGRVAVDFAEQQDIDRSDDVSAYRQKDGEFNVIVVPYESGYLEVLIFNPTKEKGTFDLSDFSSADISLRMSHIDGWAALSDEGTLVITDYSDSKLTGSFDFTTSAGKRYQGEFDVKIYLSPP